MSAVGVVVRQRRRVLCATVGVGALLAATASPAKAALTLGYIDQFSPPPPALCINPDPIDLVQATGPAAPSYTVPAAPGQSLVVTSWSHHAAPGSAPVGFKIYRPVSGATYRVVGHDGPRPLSSGAVNTFSGLHIPVLPGDVIGLHTGAAPTACHFNTPGQSYLFRTGDLADGQEGVFGQNTGEQLNVSALVAPDNRLTVARVKRNRKRGTARITLQLPNPGVLHLSGKSAAIRGARHLQVSTGALSFVVGTVGFAREKLLARGKVRVEVQTVYAPTGGDGITQKLMVKLRKRLP
jgi:hypothetical protein